jgi:adenylosuccinate lyase
MNECMETSDERGRSTWFAEFILIPESYLLMSTILNNMKVTLSSLVVHRENMRRNLGITRGMVNSEAVMMALAKRIGRQKAHHVLYNCVTRAYAEKKTFLEVLLTDKVVSAHLSKKDLESLLDPEQYLGLSSSIADKVGRLRSS